MSQEFRIETEVYAAGESAPVSRNLTLFSEHMIYDFQMTNESDSVPIEIVIFDQREKSFHLIDLARNVRLRLDQTEIVKMVEGARQQTKQNPKTKFLLDSMTEKFDVTEKWMTVGNENISYRIEGTRPPDVSILPTYFEFLDQYTRLKASDPHSLPPFARLELNRAIKKVGWIPTTIEARYKANELIRSEIKMRSKHTFIGQISKQDHERIESAKAKLIGATPVTLGKFRGLSTAEARVSSK